MKAVLYSRFDVTGEDEACLASIAGSFLGGLETLPSRLDKFSMSSLTLNIVIVTSRKENLDNQDLLKRFAGVPPSVRQDLCEALLANSFSQTSDEEGRLHISHQSLL